MHDLDATRIFWKEWRAQRLFWLGLFGLAIGLEVLLVFVAPLVQRMDLLEQFRFHEGLVVMACSFATGSAAIAFAGEVEAKTKGLLQRVPVRARDLLAGRLTFALAGSYALLVALWLIGSFLLAESRSIAISRSIWVDAAMSRIGRLAVGCDKAGFRPPAHLLRAINQKKVGRTSASSVESRSPSLAGPTLRAPASEEGAMPL